MFGMLDYRAHKIWILLGYPFILIGRVVSIFVMPFIAFAIAINYANEPFLQIIYSIFALLFIEIIWSIVFFLILWVIKNLILLFIDVMPADGRSKDEAMMVMMDGDAAITILEAAKPRPEYSDDLIHRISSINIFHRVFYFKIRHRLDGLAPIKPDTRLGWVICLL
jgi:predicted membrane protein